MSKENKQKEEQKINYKIYIEMRLRITCNLPLKQ